MTTNTNSKIQVSGISFKRGATIMMLMGGLLLSACNGDTTPTGAVTSISATAAAPTLKVGGTVQLTSKVVVTGDAKMDVTYKSNDLKIATVNATTGLVTGIAVGKVEITVTSTADITKVVIVKLEVTPAVVTATVAPDPIAKINFQPASAPVVVGFTPNGGDAFAGTLGWLNDAGAPASQAAAARLRTTTTATGSTLPGISTNPAQNGFIALQARNATTPTASTPSSAFEYVLAKGLYTVTVSSGDAQFIDSKHNLRLEKTPVAPAFEPKALQRFQTITKQVQVDDGKLTIDGTEGVVTKLNYVVIAAATNPSIRSVLPDDGQTGVAATPTITATFNLVGAAAVDAASLNADTVQLFAGATAVPGTVTPAADGQSVSFKPTAALTAATVYTFKVNGGATGAKDKGVAPAAPAAFYNFVSTFTTQ
jgi:Bacterial Ig-like domain (group 2)/Bacterial Ig-like domain